MSQINAVFEVRKDDLHTSRMTAETLPALADGQVLIAVEKFAFTANNVTYAAFGEIMQYWNFFPAEDGWGRVPVWGFGVVAKSAHPDISEGERIYGYFPMASHLLVEPTKVTPMSFSDAAAHRAELHAVYNQYLRCAGDPGYDASKEAEQMIYKPLFTTSFLLEDFLADNDFFGTSTVILSSASSKTAFGLAFMLKHTHGDKCTVIGLTSASNTGFVEKLGCYDKVVAYDDIETLDAATPVVFVDMAGSATVRSRLHNHFTNNMKYSCAVGGTHWDQGGGGDDLPGARPTLFFAPAQIAKRNSDWGADVLQGKIAQAWTAFIGGVGGDIRMVEQHGADAVKEVYLAMVDGDAKPDEGHILSIVG